jgi:hypothetical protein
MKIAFDPFTKTGKHNFENLLDRFLEDGYFLDFWAEHDFEYLGVSLNKEKLLEHLIANSKINLKRKIDYNKMCDDIGISLTPAQKSVSKGTERCRVIYMGIFYQFTKWTNELYAKSGLLQAEAKRVLDYFGLQTNNQALYKLFSGEDGKIRVGRIYSVETGNGNVAKKGSKYIIIPELVKYIAMHNKGFEMAHMQLQHMKNAIETEMDTQIKNKLKALYDDMKRQMLTPFVDAMKDKPMPRDDKPELFARIRKQISRED